MQSTHILLFSHFLSKVLILFAQGLMKFDKAVICVCVEVYCEDD